MSPFLPSSVSLGKEKGYCYKISNSSCDFRRLRHKFDLFRGCFLVRRVSIVLSVDTYVLSEIKVESKSLSLNLTTVRNFSES